MRRVSQGLVYDTDTAEDTGVEFCSGSNRGDFSFEVTSLYRSRRGRWFLAGDGGPRSRWGQCSEDNHVRGGEGIQPLSEADAKAFAEEHGTAEDYERLFGSAEEA